MTPLSRAETLALPPTHGLSTLGQVFGVSEPTIRAQHRSGELERLGIKVVKLGAQYRVITSTVWAFLGIGPDVQASGADSEEPPRIRCRPARPDRIGNAMRPDSDKLAARIAILTRHHGADAAELALLRRRLDELRVAEVAEWAASALPASAEVANAQREARRLLGAGGEVA
jgi:hypothetical protein